MIQIKPLGWELSTWTTEGQKPQVESASIYRPESKMRQHKEEREVS